MKHFARFLPAFGWCSAPLLLAGSAIGQTEPADDTPATVGAMLTYLQSKLPQLSDSNALKIAKLVDTDGNGSISADEFSQRMAAVQSVMQNEDNAPEDNAPEASEPATALKIADYMDGEFAAAAPLTAGDRATLLIITSNDLLDAWRPFATWKTQQGKATKLVSVREIAHSYEADSIQQKIRLCVRDHIDNHSTQWVLLGGDCVPGGGVVPGGPTTTHEMEPAGIPTDLVYLSTTDWDADDDGTLGEWEDDREEISYPDDRVAIGRAPVRNAADVAAFTAKVRSYESSYPTDGFAERMLFTSADNRSALKVKKSWDNYISKNWDGAAQRFFSDETPWDEADKPGSFELNAENLAENINTRTSGKIHIHGHGELDHWILEQSAFRAKHVDALDNEAAYPVITTVSCNTGEYDSNQDPSIVESMIRQPAAGSVVVLAPIRTGKMHFHDDSDFELMMTEGKLDGTTMLLTQFWIHALKNKRSTGHALAAAKNALLDDAKKSSNFHLCLCEFNLLGDPTLPVHGNNPRTPTAEAPDHLPLGKTELTLRTDAPGATVCAWKELEVYQVVEADADGTVRLSFELKTPGALLLTVAGNGFNTTTKKIPVN